MSEIFQHIQKCDGCGKEITFPASWMISDPPDKGWIAIRKSTEVARHFCPDCVRQFKAEDYLLEYLK
jgi:hypothetical protein